MDDIDLLKFSAISIGLLPQHWDETNEVLICSNGEDAIAWNPLKKENDDALELIAKLRLDVVHLTDGIVEVTNQWEKQEDLLWAWKPYGADAKFAIRRAATETAALIGEKMIQNELRMIDDE